MLVMSPHLSAHGDDGTVFRARLIPAKATTEVESKRICMINELISIVTVKRHFCCREIRMDKARIKYSECKRVVV